MSRRSKLVLALALSLAWTAAHADSRGPRLNLRHPLTLGLQVYVSPASGRAAPMDEVRQWPAPPINTGFIPFGDPDAGAVYKHDATASVAGAYRIDGHPGVSIAGPMTVAIVFRTAAVPVAEHLVSKWAGANEDYQLRLDAAGSGTLVFAFRSGGSFKSAATVSTYIDNRWYVAFGLFDGANARVRVYRLGSPVALEDIVGTAASSIDTGNTDLAVGILLGTTTNGLVGHTRDFAIWNRYLPAAETGDFATNPGALLASRARSFFAHHVSLFGYRLTEAGDCRIIEAGDKRIIEGASGGVGPCPAGAAVTPRRTLLGIGL